MLIDNSCIFKVEVTNACLNEFESSLDVINMCFNDRTFTNFMNLNNTFSLAQNDVIFISSASEKSLRHEFSANKASSEPEAE
ncbi:unnamed protein product [Cuscuta campestris]|uniref:Uncharacterized protein n=1 Tax=Cuscuta campestris TaxID=132261 RepID=A0A484NA80_9ASTE|nr:unnamed protein product [Cuscuta campestris]